MSTAQSLTRIVQQPQFEFSSEQRKMIRDSFLSGASDAEASVLLELARARRLNPITGQVHFVRRWNAERQAEVWAAQVGIDGLRSIAERTGLYDGQDEPTYDREPSPDGKTMLVCRVKVYRKDWSRPAVGVAYWSEYAQRRKDGSYTKMWAEKPRLMLAKCAEALALRKAFPEDTGGLHSDDEMGEVVEHRPEQPQGSRVEALKGRVAARVQTAPVAQAVVEQPAPPQLTPPTPPPPTRRMAIRDADDAPPEPPPHTDQDAPLDCEPAAGESDRPQLPPPATAPVTMSFGSGKGKPLSELSLKDLKWYAKALGESIEDPAKERYLEDNQGKLVAIEAELQKRGGR